MKASELVSRLTSLIETEGDCEVINDMASEQIMNVACDTVKNRKGADEKIFFIEG